MTTQNQHQLDFQLPVLKEQLTGHAVIMDSCLFLWIGQAKTEFLLFGKFLFDIDNFLISTFSGHNNHSMFIDGIPSPNNQVFLQSVCTKLCKVFPDKQVIF
jgi:hypothetical protein